MRRKEDQANRRLQNLNSTVIRQFCNNICKVVEMPVLSQSDSTEGAGEGIDAHFKRVLK